MRPFSFVLALHFATIVSAQSQVAAQEVPPAPIDDSGQQNRVVIEGTRLSPEQQARRLASEVTKRAPSEVPVAHFVDAACFGTLGLPVAMSQALVDRMVIRAIEAGAAVADDGCKPNVLVLFMQDAPAELKRLRRTQSHLFESIANDEMRAVINSDRPVQVLSTVEVRGKDGNTPTLSERSELKLRSPSRIMLPTRLDLIGAVVIIERSAVPGKTIDQLADYATMRALARTRDTDSTDTILSLFTAPDAPRNGMTAFDQSYLRTLYSTPANSYASAVMAAVGRDYARQCRGATAEADCR